jgi:hypothetical protein
MYGVSHREGTCVRSVVCVRRGEVVEFKDFMALFGAQVISRPLSPPLPVRYAICTLDAPYIYRGVQVHYCPLPESQIRQLDPRV